MTLPQEHPWLLEDKVQIGGVFVDMDSKHTTSRKLRWCIWGSACVALVFVLLALAAWGEENDPRTEAQYVLTAGTQPMFPTSRKNSLRRTSFGRARKAKAVTAMGQQDLDAFPAGRKNTFSSSGTATTTATTDVDSSKSSVVNFADLKVSDFAHPLDQEFAKRVQALPDLTNVVRALFSYLEEVVYLENLANSVQVTDKMMPNINESLKKAMNILDFPNDFKVDIYVKNDPRPNAYTLAVRGDRPFIVLHSSLIDLMNEAELQAVIGHELGHLKCEHGVLLNAVNLILLSIDSFAGPLRNLLGGPILRGLMAWQQAAELTCDRAALLVAQDKDVVVSTMIKLLGGTSKLSDDQVDTKSFLEQAENYLKASASPIGRMFLRDEERTHPVTVLRARALNEWADSKEYNQLIKDKGVQPSWQE